LTQTAEPVVHSLGEAAQFLRDARRVAVMAHVNPDADAIGSVLGLTRGLQSLGKDAVGALSDRVPEYALFLAGADAIRSTLPPDLEAIVCVDAAGVDRVGALYEENRDLFDRVPVLNVDHHHTNPLFGTVNFVDALASSTAELVFRLLTALEIQIDPPTATVLLFGIVGDTGSFQNGATTAGALETAGKLVGLGADNQGVAYYLFERKSFAAARLWGEIVGSIELDARRKIVFGVMSQRMLQSTGATAEETEGVAEYLRGISEAETVMLLKENPDGSLRLSMRSRPGVDVSRIASAFGGGGHRQAAGATVDGPPRAAKRALVEAYDRLLGA
jgi:phosphoesterase RecJ-like protein